MPVGFHAFFPGGGGAQIDASYRNFHLRRSGTLQASDFSIQPGWVNTPIKRATIPTSGMTRPFVVLRPLGAGVDTLCCVDYDAIGTGVHVYAWHNLTQAAGIEYYIFDDWSPPTIPRGLEIRDPARDYAVVYHSCWYRMRVIGVRILDATDTPNTGVWHDHDISAEAALSSRIGVALPYGRMCSIENASLYSMDVFREGVFFRSPSILTTGLVPVSSDDTWWEPATGRWNKGGIAILLVDLDNYPTNYNP